MTLIALQPAMTGASGEKMPIETLIAFSLAGWMLPFLIRQPGKKKDFKAKVDKQKGESEAKKEDKGNIDSSE